MAIFSGTRAPGPMGASTAAAAPTKSPHISTRARAPARRTLRRAARSADGGVGAGERSGRTREEGVAVVEAPAVGGEEPVAAAVPGPGHADDRLVQLDA